MEEPVQPLTVLKARIALLATAIGGPDYSSNIDPPPYQLGDDCLACLKDLKRWFRLVDDKQKRWDVAIAVAEYHILTDDLLPILIDWENKSYLAGKLAKGKGDVSAYFKNKSYYDKIALNCLQLMVLMTWPLILTDQSTPNQINYYSELKKYQLIYKKAILSAENGKVIKAAVRIAHDVMKIERLERTARDNLILKLVLNFIRNILAIEPGELTVTAKKNISSKGINSIDTLPPNVTLDDISLNSVISSFQKNKVFPFLLTLGSSINKEFDQDFINIPLLEVMFFLTKDVNHKVLFPQLANMDSRSVTVDRPVSRTGHELSELLNKENQLKKKVVMNTSARHSRFGAMLSIQTYDKGRLTITGGQNLLDNSKALQKLDDSKRSKGRMVRVRDERDGESLPSNLLNAHNQNFTYLSESTIHILKKYIENFIDSSFNLSLRSITSHFTTEQDKMLSLEQIEYLLFFAWFIRYQILRNKYDETADLLLVSESLKETTFILVSSLLRSSYDTKNWIVVHAAMIAFNELLRLVNQMRDFDDNEDIEYILGRLFSDERIQLLSNLPRVASTHSYAFMRSSIELTHTVLKILEMYNGDNSLVIESKSRKRRQQKVSKEDYERLVNEEGLDPDEALEVLQPSSRVIEVNFKRVQSSFFNRNTIDLYINLLKRYNELEYDHLKLIISFFYRVFVEAKEEMLFYRLDFIILLRDILGPDGMSRNSKGRKHLNEFAKYFLSKLKTKLKSSPAWYVGVLFPPLNDGIIGYYQKYGEHKSTKESNYYAVEPSDFHHIDDQEMMSESILLDIKLGILVSTLIDDGLQNLVEAIRDNLRHVIDVFTSHLQIIGDESNGTPNNEIFDMGDREDVNPLVYNRDFRALAKLIGYTIPKIKTDICFMIGTNSFSHLIKCEESITKYLNIPFETPNGKPSSSYLKRRNETDSIFSDGWNANEEYDLNDGTIIPDDEIDDGDYFRDLDNSKGSKSKRDEEAKGIAKKKKRRREISRKMSKKSGVRLPNSSDPEAQKTTEKLKAFSKEYISDSEDEDDNVMNPIFFENELYMRWLLDKYNGQLPNEKFLAFGKFANERMENNGEVKSDFTALFDGPIPKIDTLELNQDSSKGPDKTLLSLSTVNLSELESEDEMDNNTSVKKVATIEETQNKEELGEEEEDDDDDDDENVVIKKRKSVV
ncbi:Topoisomerase 1-associated factor 1 [Nakaseomyces bracarensis]|uniref:Topoisomerase 1-associated factor 1 n=1 Tax=Nakaseomyces bracarensis TaxID=273131 RepID=A0ABR4NQB8_9SACH